MRAAAIRNPVLAALFIGVLAISAGRCGDDDPAPTAPTPSPAPAPAPAPAPSPAPAPTPAPAPPPAPAALSSLTLSSSSAQSQRSVTGTITLTAAAPAGNASVSLESSNRDVARVPSNTSVPAGSTTATFTVDTSSVGVNTSVTITASYLGVTRTATLTVTPPPLEARFTFNSPTRGTEGCEISNNAGPIDCRFDASSSTGVIDQFLWTVSVGGDNYEQNSTQSQVTLDTPCSLLDGATEDDNGRIQIQVSLRLRGRDGTTSSAATRTILIWTNGRCGF